MICNSSIEQWSESIYSLDDEKFFDIIRIYIGEVKTPYNKQRLIEQLASFVNNPGNQNNILALLDETDLKILNAICYIKNPTRDLIARFFENEYSVADVYSVISNLSSRLIIFSYKDKFSGRESYKINPFLWKKIENLINLKVLLNPEVVTSLSVEDAFSLSPVFLMAFVSFIKHFGCSCKSDGTLKKNDVNRLMTIFPEKQQCFQLLYNAFLNLNLIVETEKSSIVDDDRFRLFSELPEIFQYSLLCASSCSRFSREGLKKEAQLLLDFLSSVPESGFTRSTIVKLAFLSNPTTSADSFYAQSRFSQLLEMAKSQPESGSTGNSVQLLDRMIDSAIIFGLLSKKGVNEKGEAVYVSSLSSKSVQLTSDGSLPKAVNVDSIFTVSIMPGLPLKALLPLADFLEVRNFGIVTEFEINRHSATLSFDNGMKPEKMFKLLSELVPYELPQNLQVSVTEWYNSYSSAMIYQGYVLKVTDNNIQFVENNPNIQRYIKEKLAEGIYLLNVPVTEKITAFIQDSGLDFMGQIKNSSYKTEKIPFPLLRNGNPVLLTQSTDPVQVSLAASRSILRQLKDELKKMDLTKNQMENLEYKINNRMILSVEQLHKVSIRTEILEAGGLDYAGKLHLLSAAQKEGDLVELQLPSANGSGEIFTVVGKVLGITKEIDNSIMRFSIEPGQDIQNFVVGQIAHIKRLRF